MDENTFCSPEREDHELPVDLPAPGADREDNDLPANDYIDSASALFQYAPEEICGDGPVPPVPAEPALADPIVEDGPTPPFLQAPPDGVAPLPLVPPVSVPPAPMRQTGLPPAEKENGKRGKPRKKALSITLGVCAAVALIAGAVVFFLLHDVSVNRKNAGYIDPDRMPETTEEIADFYKAAVRAVRKNGKAGYSKKKWQTVSSLNITGITFVDDIIGDVFEEYVTPADKADTDVCKKGTIQAKQSFPAFELTDYSVIRSAECKRYGNNYRIKMVFDEEDTPVYDNSFLGKATDTVLYWDTQIVPVLTVVSQLKEYSDVHIVYTDMTIEAELSNDGQFVFLRHSAPAEVSIGSLRLSLFTFTDKQMHFECIAEYSDFIY